MVLHCWDVHDSVLRPAYSVRLIINIHALVMDEVFVTGHWHIVEHASHTPQPRRSAAEKPLEALRRSAWL